MVQAKHVAAVGIVTLAMLYGRKRRGGDLLQRPHRAGR